MNDMYLINNNVVFFLEYTNVFYDTNNFYLWHLRLGHINKDKMLCVSISGLIPQIDPLNFNTWESCVKGKMTQKPFTKHWKFNDLLEVIHLDICGPLRTKTNKGIDYFVTFTNDYLRFGHIYLLKYVQV